MALAANALTTHTAVLAQYSTTKTQAQIEQLINQVSDGLQGWLNRQLGTKQYTTSAPEKLAGAGRQALILSRGPITIVEEVKVNGTLLVEDTDFERLEDYDERGWLFRDSGWPMCAGTFVDLTRDPDTSRRSRNITVAYTGGYVLPQAVSGRTLPYDIEGIVIDAVGSWLGQNRPTDLQEETTPGGWRRKWASALPAEQRLRAFATLGKYKKWCP